MPTITQRIRSGWNAFIGRDPTKELNFGQEIGFSYNGIRPDRVRYSGGNYRAIVASVYNRIAVDVASIEIAPADPEGIQNVVAGPAFDANAPIYDVVGRQVSAPLKKGIYIQNGRKFIVK